MQKYIMLMIAGILLASSGLVFAAPGGILPDGQGTNQVYGDVNGRDQTLRNIKTANVDGSGITNIGADKLTVGSKLPAVDGSAVTNIAGASITSLDASKLTAGSTASAINGSAITNINPVNVIGGAIVENDVRLTNARAPTAHSTDWAAVTNRSTTLSGYGITDAVTDGDDRLTDARTPLGHNQGWNTITNTPTTVAGYGITDAVSSGDLAGYISTNTTGQSKAGLLTLNGGVTVAGKAVFTPSTLQTVAAGAAIAANAVVVQVAGDSGPVTATIATAGAVEGQTLLIRGTSDVNSVNLTNTVPSFMMGAGDVIQFTWNGTAWVEQYRRDN